MKRLSDALEKKPNIQQVFASTIEEAILKVYNSDKYNFFHNSELIDVKNKFRIFEYEGNNYLSKKMPEKKGLAEYSSSLKAANLLDGKMIDDYCIEVIMPNLFKINNEYYIVTEYKGNTLQESLYSNERQKFTIQNLKQMIELFSNLGIDYIGLCPRNMVVSEQENKIYLFDFENAKFNKKIDYYNMLFKTNIFVNWSYLYNQEDLEKILCFSQMNVEKEPELNGYEINYKKMIGFSGNNCELRENIMRVVLGAEKKVDKLTSDFCILPMDMASIISDLFDFDIDAIMDITFYLIRKNNEELYKKILYNFSKNIISAYKNNYELQSHILPLLLYSIIIASSDETDKMQLLKYYSNGNLQEFKRELSNKLNVIFKNIYSDFNMSNLNFDSLSKYLFNIGNRKEVEEKQRPFLEEKTILEKKPFWKKKTILEEKN